MSDMADKVIPILPSGSLDQTVDFYGRLGFQIAARYEKPDEYLIVRRGDVELHFFPWPEIDPWSSIAGCYLRVDDASEWYDAWADLGIPDSGIPRLTNPTNRDGVREFALVDPDGNLLRVGQAMRQS